VIRRVGAALLAAALLPAGAVRAAPPWSAPTLVALPAAGTIGPVALAFSPGGRGLLTFNPPVDSPVLAASTSASDRFVHVSPLTGAGEYLPDLEHDVAVYGRDRLIVAGGLTGAIDRAWVATGRIGRPHGPRLLLAIPPVAELQGGTIAVAANARGDAAVIAVRCLFCSGRPVAHDSPLYLVARHAGHRFGRPITVSRHAGDTSAEFRGDGVAPAVALNAAGDVLVVWRSFGDGTTLYARILHAGRWRAPAQVIGQVQNFGRISAQLSDRGRAVVFWWTQPGSGGGAGTGPTAPPVFELATAGVNGRFTPERAIEQGTTLPGECPECGSRFFPAVARVAAVGDATGRVVLAWTGARFDHDVVRAATVRRGRLGTIQELGSGFLDQLALGPRGEALALWSASPGSRLMASPAPPGGAFAGVPEEVAAPNPYAVGGVAAFDPRSGRAVAAWAVPTGPELPATYTALRPALAP
jgi:hypothetical protein